MKALIVVAHPEPSSFCVAMANCATETLTDIGYDVTVSDLYAQQFNPCGGPADVLVRVDETRFAYQREQMSAAASGTFEPELAHEIARLQAADLVIFNFPLWWFGLPAILKGWVDRVFAMGIAYGPGQSHATGPLRGKRAMLALTTGAPEPIFSSTSINGDIGMLLFPIQYGMLHFAGMDVLPPFVAFGAARCDQATRANYLTSYANTLRNLEAAQPLTLLPNQYVPSRHGD